MEHPIETQQLAQSGNGQRWSTETTSSGLRNLLFVALIGVAVAIAVGALMAEAPNHPGDALFGCPEELEPLVIANVDCNLGVADAFGRTSTAAVAGDVTPTAESGRAPWCTDVADLTIYGCAHCVDEAPSQPTPTYRHPEGKSLPVETSHECPARRQQVQTALTPPSTYRTARLALAEGRMRWIR